MIFIHILILIITFYLLAIICDEYFVKTLESISKKLKLSSEVTGATFMAIGSSAPELFTSIFSIFAIFGNGGGNESLGAGTIVGSAIFNILVIVGASILFMRKQKKLTWQPVIRDLIFYSLSIALLLFCFRDGKITFFETIIFVLGYILYIFIVKNRGKRLNYKIKDDIEQVREQEIEKNEDENIINKYTKKVLNIFFPKKLSFRRKFIINIVFIGILSHFMVESAVTTANILSIPQAIIGLTILAAGTSIPDLISSIIVAKKGKGDMAISNAIGSNIFDILFGLGFIYFIYMLINGTKTTIPVDTHNLNSSIILLFATVITILAVLLLRKWKTGKFIGYLLIILYVGYLGFNVIKALNIS